MQRHTCRTCQPLWVTSTQDSSILGILQVATLVNSKSGKACKDGLESECQETVNLYILGLIVITVVDWLSVSIKTYQCGRLSLQHIQHISHIIFYQCMITIAGEKRMKIYCCCHYNYNESITGIVWTQCGRLSFQHTAAVSLHTSKQARSKPTCTCHRYEVTL